MNNKWPLYIAASINKHFDQYVTSDADLLIRMFYEGLSRTEEEVNSEHLVEVRFTGPFWTILSSKSYKANLIINCVLQSTIGDKNNYKIWRVFGKVDDAFSKPILIYNYEEGQNDPQQLGCLQLVQNRGSDIVNNYLGQVDPALQRVQGEVTAHFTIDLEDSA